MGFPGDSDSKESSCIAGDMGWTSGLGGSPGEGKGYPLQNSCLKNPMNREAWWVVILGVSPGFIAAWFTIARTWKQPRCPSADKWIRKLWYLYTMEYYSAIKKHAFESVLMRWMKLEPIIQSEVSQKEKYQYSILTHIYGI